MADSTSDNKKKPYVYRGIDSRDLVERGITKECISYEDLSPEQRQMLFHAYVQAKLLDEYGDVFRKYQKEFGDFLARFDDRDLEKLIEFQLEKFQAQSRGQIVPKSHASLFEQILSFEKVLGAKVQAARANLPLASAMGIEEAIAWYESGYKDLKNPNVMTEQRQQSQEQTQGLNNYLGTNNWASVTANSDSNYNGGYGSNGWDAGRYGTGDFLKPLQNPAFRRQSFEQYSQVCIDQPAAFSPKQQPEQLLSSEEKQQLIKHSADSLEKQYQQRMAAKADRATQAQNSSLGSQDLAFGSGQMTAEAATQAQPDATQNKVFGSQKFKPTATLSDYERWYYYSDIGQEHKVRLGLPPQIECSPALAAGIEEKQMNSLFHKADARYREYVLSKIGTSDKSERQYWTQKLHRDVDKWDSSKSFRVSGEWREFFNEAMQKHYAAQEAAVQQWQESKAAKILDNSTGAKEIAAGLPQKDPDRADAKKAQPEGNQEQPQGQVKIGVADLKSWRREAEALERPKEYLEKIDKILNSACDEENNSVEISLKAFNARQHERQKFIKLGSELIAESHSQQHTTKQPQPDESSQKEKPARSQVEQPQHDCNPVRRTKR